jgi:hypothetical protein
VKKIVSPIFHNDIGRAKSLLCCIFIPPAILIISYLPEKIIPNTDLSVLPKWMEKAYKYIAGDEKSCTLCKSRICLEAVLFSLNID